MVVVVVARVVPAAVFVPLLDRGSVVAVSRSYCDARGLALAAAALRDR